ERTKRAAAEEANARLEFLSRAGAVLGQSLDQDVTAREVVSLPLPLLASETALVYVQPEGRVTGWRRGRMTPTGPVVTDGQGRDGLGQDLCSALDRGLAAENPVGESGRTLVLPLRARDRAFGVLVLSRGHEGRGFVPADVWVAQTFASRA